MNATKRKFNNLIQGIGAKPSSTGSPKQANDGVAQASFLATDDTSLTASATVPTTPSRPAASPLADTTHNANFGAPDDSTATMTSSSSNLPDILNKRRRVAGVLESTIRSDKAVTTSPSRFSSNKILERYKATAAAVGASAGKITKPVTASRYCPGDRDELIRRLGTFQELTEWTPKPDQINEIEWAKRGWVCQGKERVRCTLCNKELVVKLSSEKKGAAEQVSQTRPSTACSIQLQEAMATRFVELIVDAHLEDCLWRKRGCDDSLLRLQITSPQTALSALRERYDDLANRPIFLPYLFNLRLPPDLDLEKAKSHLPDDFYSNPAPSQPPAPQTTKSTKDVALALAMTGWQGLTNPRIGPVPNSASCATCLRKLGLWMFKSKEVDEATGQVLVPAPMDFLDPIREHRFFCPWRNPEAQRNSGSKNPESKAAWEVLATTLKNNAYLKSQAARSNTKSKKDKTPSRMSTILHRATASVPATPSRGTLENMPTTPGNATPGDEEDRGRSVMLGPDMVDDDDEDPSERDSKDKERWARLRKVKTLFDTKTAKKLRRSLSRPRTAASTKSVGGEDVRPETAGGERPDTGTGDEERG